MGDCSIGIATNAGWVRMGFWGAVSAALVWRSTLKEYLISFSRYLDVTSVFHGASFGWGGFGLFHKWWGTGLLGNYLLGENGLIMFCLSSTYSFIFFLKDRKGLTCVPSGLHVDASVLLSLLKVCIPFQMLL